MSSYRPQRPPRHGGGGGGDSYHPRDNGRGQHRAQSSSYRDFNDTRNSNHPPPPGFDSFRPPQSDFTFRAEKPAGIKEARFDGGGGGGTGDHRRDRRKYRQDYDGRRGGARDGGRGGRGYRPYPHSRRLAADRPILNATHDANKELSFVESASGVTYRALGELSDSDEADMDMSENDGLDAGAEQATGRSTKKRRLSGEDASGNSAPKWSNPDPYTAAPPPDISQPKKKNVVQLIRKARMQPAEGSKPAVSLEGADFISCNLDDSEGEDDFVPLSSGRTRHKDVSDVSAPKSTQHLQPKNSQQPQPKHTEQPQTSLPGAPPKAGQTTINHIGGHDNNPLTIPARPPPSSDLGSRKRTHDDVIKIPEHAKLKRHTTKMAPGSLLKEWVPQNGQNTCPWVTTDHSAHHSVAVWLHKELVDFYEYVKPCDFEEKLRQSLVDELAKLVRNEFKNTSVYPFGSFKAGLYLPTGDMDLALCSDKYMSHGVPQFQAKRQVHNFGRFVERRRLAHQNHVERISRARVPLVKYVDSRTGLKVDVSFENITGVTAIKTFLDWREQFPSMPMLVTFVKHFLAMRGLNEPANGGIGGFSVICMVVSMLQLMPEVQSRSLVPEQHLGQLLLEFFDLYGNKFQYEKMAISLNPPGYVRKNEVQSFVYKNMDRLSIIDPNDHQNDISGGSSNSRTIKATFSKAHELLRDRIAFLARSPTNAPFSSVLEPLFAGNYSSFEDQRKHMRALWERSQAFRRQ